MADRLPSSFAHSTANLPYITGVTLNMIKAERVRLGMENGEPEVVAFANRRQTLYLNSLVAQVIGNHPDRASSIQAGRVVSVAHKVAELRSSLEDIPSESPTMPIEQPISLSSDDISILQSAIAGMYDPHARSYAEIVRRADLLRPRGAAPDNRPLAVRVLELQRADAHPEVIEVAELLEVGYSMLHGMRVAPPTPPSAG